MPPVGELLRQRRLEHRWTIEDVVQRTRIRREYLEALEEGNYDLLPADVQTRGFLRSYANLLGLNIAEVLSAYEQDRGEPHLDSIAPLSPPPRTRSFVLPSLVFVILSMAAVAATAYLLSQYFGWFGTVSPSPSPTKRVITPTAILPTPTPTPQILLESPTPTTAISSTPGVYTGLEATLKVSTACWVRVVADGIETFQGTLGAGTERTFKATQELRIRMGNAGGVQVTLNGEDLGVQGNPGQVVDRTWKAEE